MPRDPDESPIVCGVDDSEIHSAIKRGDRKALEDCIAKMMSLLLDNGAVINALDENTGDTAAHYVTMSLSGGIRQSGCMIVLAEHGADVDIRNDDGYTVFELAAKNGNSEIAEAYASVVNA
jgi:ankyrin repeat protein